MAINGHTVACCPRPEVSATYTVAISAEAEEELPWDARILARIDAGIDPTLIVENRRRTPTDRLRRMQEMLRFFDQVRTLERSASSIGEIRK